MQQLIDTQNGVPSLLASIVVVMCVQLIVKVGLFVWEMVKKRGDISEKSVENLARVIEVNTNAVDKLENRIQQVEKDLSEIPKFKLDIRRLYLGMRALAGDQWPSIRQEIMEDDLPSGTQ